MHRMNMTAVRPEDRPSISPAPIAFQVGKERLKLNLAVKDVALRMFFCLQTTRDVHECPMDNEGSGAEMISMVGFQIRFTGNMIL